MLLERNLQHVHVIAHSAGAFVAYGIEQGLARAKDRPTLHVTLLDPFMGLGLDFQWGQTRFGAQADFAESYLDRGDGVPGTEAPALRAHTFDVTHLGARGEAWTGTAGHWWPTTAYGVAQPGFSLSLEASGAFEASALRERFPPGQVE